MRREEMSRSVMTIPSSLIRLDYNPAKDVLSVVWPDIQSYTMDKVRHTLKEVIDTVRYYDVKRLLIDSTTTVIGISREDYATFAIDFGLQLKKTRLEKVARLESSSNEREEQAQDIAKNALIDATTIAFKNFSDREDALLWLETGY